MRLFIAVKFNREIEELLKNMQNELRKSGVTGNYTNCDNLHLTLAFIGEYNYPEAVLHAIRHVSFKPFELSVEGNIGNFGDILWAGTSGSAQLSNLSADVRKALSINRIPFDKKPFRPHITVVRRAYNYKRPEKQMKEIVKDKKTMTVDKILLMNSHRIEGRLVYTEIGRIEAE